MQYKGELYGKVGDTFIPLKERAEDVDNALEDVKRLDWIEKTGGRCGQYAEGFFAHELAQGDKFEHGGTLREAIDAAMSNSVISHTCDH